ncbi:MAG: aminotransferase class V-fold PLP-dependent enzyme [Faecalicoccus sp.]|uniref:cysteine desulfurase family protein n=1 Tax=Faecalicoccus sp. TaxID=1971758 RepID=UPI002A83764F|nr:aminotransferase class V-fold PLP-dependent enzyme [Faecalicoccus sp.]MDY4279420.1 aminotransferase class V-fold PLP-dependent enzyme [Faecalicoccus sp.]
MSVYLDFNSSVPIHKEVLNCMMDVYRNVPGNSDSRTHEFGELARKTVEDARGKVASILNVNSDEVFFTSGATESDNIAIQGLREYGITSNKKHIITTTIEHKAVLETVKIMGKQGFEIDFVNPDSTGRISSEELLCKLRDDTLLVSVMHVNNETGIIQPIKEIGDVLAKNNILFHVDATQSFGKLVDELKEVKYDMLSMSAHKIGGPQGVGALILKKRGYKLPPIKPIIFGGQQEHGIRPGTVPVALVAGLGKACEIAQKDYKKNNDKCKKIKEKIISMVEDSDLQFVFNGNQNYAIDNTLNICICGVASEALMLSSKGYCGISNGSACNSKSYSPSYVLSAMEIPVEQIENSIRISWGPDLQISDVEEAFGKLLDTAKKLVW